MGAMVLVSIASLRMQARADGSDGSLGPSEDPPALEGPPLYPSPAWSTQSRARPSTADTPRRACSFSRPVCVHGAPSVPPQSLAAALAALERAFDRLVGVLGLPRPLPDGALGGGPEFDFYVVRNGPSSVAGPWVQLGRDDLLPFPLDRASAFAVASFLPSTGCELDHGVAAALAQAIQMGIDAAEQSSIRAAIAEHLADVAAPCADDALVLLDAAQRHPERALTLPIEDPQSHAAPPLFVGYLDTALSAAGSGTLPIALATLAAQKTPPGSLRFHNEPDLWDALRATLEARSPKVEVGDMLLDFAIARAFIGGRDDGKHVLGDPWSGSFGRVRFEWAIPFASLPRRLAPRAPIDPTGSTYVWIDLKGAPPGARLVLRAEWEPPTAFRWAVVRVDASGHEASRVVITAEQRSTSAERNVDRLDGLSGLLVVGVNVGDLGLSHPFDPDEIPYEPHGYVLTLAQ
jgi:hypothetical protein